MSRARDIADGKFANDLTVTNGDIKLDGNYPTGSSNVALGNAALDDGSLSGANNTAIGSSAMTANTSGAANTTCGSLALDANTTGNNNSAFGVNALSTNTTADGNSAFGYQALYSNSTGTDNVAVGVNSLFANTASNNTAVGKQALTANTTGSGNSSFGSEAMKTATTALNSVMAGFQAGRATTTGSWNTFVGANAGDDNTTGFGNSFFGTNYSGGAGSAVTTGNRHTIIGGYTGNGGSYDIRTSNNFIVLSDGDGNPRGVFDNNGQFMVNFGQTSDIDGKIGGSSGSTTFGVQKSDGLRFAHPGTTYWNRFSDGVIVYFRSAGTTEGSIQVSGSTVSFNGGHLSRWSQLADNTRDTSIVKGTVMTNLNQMAEWTTDGVTEENEQLNCMAVSSVEGDANVAGVFVSWDDDDTDYHNDMTVAMTGDMVIRIAQGTTVAQGDLLMSAGDGTAKPQGDDIVRSKTIAKVTSTSVSHTYDDGSFLVPCVLMAC